MDKVKESPEKNDIYSTRVIILRPSKNEGFDIFVQEKKGGKLEIPGGKNDSFTANNNLATLNRGLNNELKRQETSREIEEEIGININEKKLIPLAFTSIIDRKNPQKDSLHHTQTYISVINSNEDLILNGGFDDFLTGGEFYPFISTNKDYKNPKKNDLKNITKNTAINLDPKILSVFQYYFPKEEQFNRVINRLKIILQTKEFALHTKKMLEESSLQKIINRKRTAKETNVFIQGDNDFIAPNGKVITMLDIMNEFPNLSDENKKYILELKFKKNGDLFFQDPKIKEGIEKLALHEDFFGSKKNTEIKLALSKIQGFLSFEEICLNEENNEISPFLIVLFSGLKKLFDEAITPQKITETLPLFKNIIEKNIFDCDSIDSFDARHKSIERLVTKLLIKGKNDYIPNDLVGGRLVVKQGKQEEVANFLFEIFKNDKNITDIKMETGSIEKRANEYKIEGKINGIGFEIQINDGDGFAQTESNSNAHKIYELVRMLVLKSRFFWNESSHHTEKSLEDWVKTQLNKDYRTLNGKTTEEVTKEFMKKIKLFGFFDQTTQQFIDYQTYFTQQHVLENSEEGRKRLKITTEHFNQQLNIGIDLTQGEWKMLFISPFTFFRKYKNEKINKELLYREIVKMFFFKIKGESSFFSNNLRMISPEVYDDINQEYLEFKNLEKEIQDIKNKYNNIDKMIKNQNIFNEYLLFKISYEAMCIKFKTENIFE